MSRATRAYRRGAARARRRMTRHQRAVFDAIAVEGLDLRAAARRLDISETDVIALFATALRLHIAEIEAIPQVWWCWRWWR